MAKKENKSIPVASGGNALRVLKRNNPQDEDRHLRIERIKSEVAEGTYSVDSRDVAKAIIKKTKESSRK